MLRCDLKWQDFREEGHKVRQQQRTTQSDQTQQQARQNEKSEGRRLLFPHYMPYVRDVRVGYFAVVTGREPLQSVMAGRNIANAWAVPIQV
jgi:hypothetical protein